MKARAVEMPQDVKNPLLCVDFGSLGAMGLIENPHELLFVIMSAVAASGWYGDNGYMTLFKITK